MVGVVEWMGELMVELLDELLIVFMVELLDELLIVFMVELFMELFNELIVFMDGPIEVVTILSKDEESTTCRRRSIRRPNSCIALYLTLPINPRTHPYHLHRTNSLIISNTIIRTN